MGEVKSFLVNSLLVRMSIHMTVLQSNLTVLMKSNLTVLFKSKNPHILW